MAKKKKGKERKKPAAGEGSDAAEEPRKRPGKEFDAARSMFRSGDFESAVRALQGLVRKNPDNFEALALLASCHSFQGNYEEAVRCHEAAVKADPSDAQRWHGLASDLLNLGDVERAEKAMREALKLDGNRGSSHYNMARIIARKGDYESALSSLRKAVELQPELRDSMTEQPDFAPLAEDDRFKQLVSPKKDEFDYPYFERGEA